MRELELLLRGLIAGLIIAVPVGPVNVLCVHRTVEKGWRSGIVSGLGAAAGDALYGAVAGFSIQFVIQWLIREEFWIRVVGGLLLVLIGASYLVRRPRAFEKKKDNGGDESDFTSTFLLNLTNPTVVLSFLAVLAALGLGEQDEIRLGVFLVTGIFCGSMAWWIVLATVVNHYRDRFNSRVMCWTNRVAGLAIGAFGVATFLTGLKHSSH